MKGDVTYSTFARSYLRSAAKVLRDLEPAGVDESAAILLDAYRRGATVFVAGNGGSAAIATHLACDLEKTVAGPRDRRLARRLRAVALGDNLSALTAWANDEGYEQVFSERLRGHADPGDVLLAISSSGNSPNVLRALEVAREIGMHTIAWLGFDGGRALRLADCAVHVAVHDYGMVEGAHGVVAHLVTDLLVAAVRDEPAAQRHSSPRLARVGGT